MKKHEKLTEHYVNFIEALTDCKKTDFDLTENEISESIFKHIFKVKLAQWKLRINFKREKKTAISDLFQDIIAYYLKIYLSDDYEIILEQKKGKFRPDILIRYKENNLFIIEIKTDLGFARSSVENEIPKRIENLSKKFNLSKDNIVYILISPFNVNKNFLEKYWDKVKQEAQEMPKEFPYNKIRPLLANDDPFYFRKKHKKEKIEPKDKYRNYNDKEINDLAEKSIIIPLERTIKDIITAANSVYEK